MRSLTTTRLLTSTALTAATIGSLLGVAAPASAASTVTVTVNLEVSGQHPYPYDVLPINSVNLRTYDAAGKQVGGYCVYEADQHSTDTSRRTITPADGYAVPVPVGGKVEGRASASNCWAQLESTLTTYVVGTTDATVSWYLHP